MEQKNNITTPPSKKIGEWALASLIFGALTILLFCIINSSLGWWKYDILEGALVLSSFILPTIAIISGIVGLLRARYETVLSSMFSLLGFFIGVIEIFYVIAFLLKAPR